MNHGTEGYADDGHGDGRVGTYDGRSLATAPSDTRCHECVYWRDQRCHVGVQCFGGSRHLARADLRAGRKDDDGKPRYDLLPFDALDPVVRVLTSGAKRYGDENWREVDGAPRRYFAAALRHVTAWASGHEKDRDTGESHLAHAVCCLLFLLALNAKPPTSTKDSG